MTDPRVTGGTGDEELSTERTSLAVQDAGSPAHAKDDFGAAVQVSLPKACRPVFPGVQAARTLGFR